MDTPDPGIRQRIGELFGFSQGELAAPDVFEAAAAAFLCRKSRGDRLPEGVVFRKVRGGGLLARLGRFRLSIYRDASRYMLEELDGRGLDAFDHHGDNYVALRDGQIVSAVRLTAPPHVESIRLSNAGALDAFLGRAWRRHFLEFSRLVSQRNREAIRSTRLLLMFAGFEALFFTAYTRYFGCVSSQLTSHFARRFRSEVDPTSFMIERRDRQSYHLVKGDFVGDFERLYRVRRARAAARAALPEAHPTVRPSLADDPSQRLSRG